jgi:ribulose-phosphate 3-epimerase
MGKISPSILSADFSRLGEEVRSVEKAGADYIHVDVMDGRFVPNITIGPLVVRAVRKLTKLPLDVHLMISDPDRYVEDFIKAGADILTIHAEAVTHLHRSIQHIRGAGARPGVALNPATSPECLNYVIGGLEMVVVMSVNPGFGGQEFIPEVIPKIGWIRDLIRSKGLSTEIEVDGGINPDTIHEVASEGADVFVAGSAVFYSKDYAETIRVMKERMAAAERQRK